MKKLLVFLVVIFFAVMSVCSALTVIGKSGTMLRATPNGKKIMKLTAGDMLTPTGKQQKMWIEVKTEAGKTGWVWAKNTDFNKGKGKMMKAQKGKAAAKAKRAEKKMMKKEMKAKEAIKEPVEDIKNEEPSTTDETETNQEMPEDDEE